MRPTELLRRRAEEQARLLAGRGALQIGQGHKTHRQALLRHDLPGDLDHVTAVDAGDRTVHPADADPANNPNPAKQNPPNA